ncbi:hypothetical protein B296_00030178 [Ensete ventricosum]|uniref:Root UVB sensitive protein C-terminal domain-containing protein n=1 Tax=Ensete ventricosum TaxID=4639 RepID=A0A426XNY2_ENSVE|nr:hypothetical protein B296_00030178 [Ensete ventricosum]
MVGQPLKKIVKKPSTLRELKDIYPKEKFLISLKNKCTYMVLEQNASGEDALRGWLVAAFAADMKKAGLTTTEIRLQSEVWLESNPSIESRFGQCSWELARSASGARREYRELAGWCKGVRWKNTETRRKIIEGSRKACREFNHDKEKVLQIRHGPKIKLRHLAKDWMMQWELARSSLGDSSKGSGSSLGICQGIAEGRP